MNKNDICNNEELIKKNEQKSSEKIELIEKIISNKGMRIAIIAVIIIFIGFMGFAIYRSLMGFPVTVGFISIGEDPYLESNVINTCQARVPTCPVQTDLTTIPLITQTNDTILTPTPTPSSISPLSNTNIPGITTTPTIFSQGTSVILTPEFEYINPCVDESPWIFDQNFLYSPSKEEDCLDNLKKYGYYPLDNGIHINLTTIQGNNIYSISRQINNENWTISFTLTPTIYFGKYNNNEENVGYENSAIFYVGLYNSKFKQLEYRLINIKNTVEDEKYNIYVASNNKILNNKIPIKIICVREDARVTCNVEENDKKGVVQGIINLDTVHKTFDSLVIGFDLNENTTIDIYLESLIIEFN